MKKVICFDLDGTLTESKTVITSEMAELLAKLQKIKKVVIIGGASFSQFQKQFTSHLNYFDNLYIMPTCGAAFFKYENNKWTPIYQLHLSPVEKKKIYEAFDQAFVDIDYHNPELTYGQIIENRDTEISFSTLGQEAPLSTRKSLKYDRRPEIITRLKIYIPEFSIALSGTNTIDVTRYGIDKGYAIEQLGEYFDVSIGDMVFVGDAIYEGRNDYAVVRTGIDTVLVSGPADTQRFIKSLLVLP
ncbi:HAD-IIB family hydrolase [Candidatus Amesbacteria bacterium]|nr:HAD-IIB family hydrolase [Candidatus Amesbacteria bacterium]